MTEHRAKQRLGLVNPQYQWLYKILTQAREQKHWPDTVFVPRPVVRQALPAAFGGEDVLRNYENGPNRISFNRMLSAGLTFSIWRVTQGIYRFDESLYSELIHTQSSGELPADVLIRLPEWCVYLEAPGLTYHAVVSGAVPIHGVWARIDLDKNNEPLLVLTLDTDHSTAAMPVTLHLQLSDSVEQSICASLNAYRNEHARQNVVKETASWVHPIINLLLYLCSEADYAGPAPRNPIPTKTKHGYRLFAPHGATTWNVGVRMGAALRAAYAAQAQSEGDHVRHLRPHIRRAHWHGFRSGPRFAPDGEPIPTASRRFELRWLPPVPVNIDQEELPSVIRPVKSNLS